MEDPNQADHDETMSTAYYNLGVEHEHLRDYEAAQECFAKSKLGKDILPEIESKNKEIEHKRLQRLANRYKNSVQMTRGFKAPILTPIESPRSNVNHSTDSNTKMVGRQFRRNK